MKYEEKINLNFDNTMSIFISMIKEESVVLEFGPASGRLTKYLKEEKNCKIYIVEIDKEAGMIASQYAEDAIIGDIQDYEWETKFKNISFDYILFADVLEHLSEPDQVLNRCKNLLADSGKIIISVPNIAHNSVIIDLLKNKFEYQQTGILDNTHLKFWSYDSMSRMLNESELYVEEYRATYSQVGANEFDNSYQDLPEEVALYLRTREDGEIYQHIFLVTPDPVGEIKREIVDKRDHYFSQIFLDNGVQAIEQTDLHQNILFDKRSYSFQVYNKSNDVKMRFDPLNKACIVKVECKAREKGHSDFVKLEIESSNAVYCANDLFVFDTEDPQIYYVVKNFEEMQIEMYICDFFTSKKIIEEIITCKNIVEQKENYIQEQRTEIQRKNNEIKEQREIVEQKENYIQEQRSIVEQKENYIQEQRSIVEQKENYIQEQRTIISNRDRQIQKQKEVMFKMEKDITKYQYYLNGAIPNFLYRLNRKFESIKGPEKEKKILVLNPYISTLGGGEKHMGYFCKTIENYYGNNVRIDILVFNSDGVDVYADDFVTIEDINKQFGLDLQCTYIRKFDLPHSNNQVEYVKNKRTIEKLTKEYDVFINFMFLSKHIGRAKKNIYQCMFPPVRYEHQMEGKGKFIGKIFDILFFRSYNIFISNSAYTNHWLGVFWKVAPKNKIVYPPVFSEYEIIGRYEETKKKNIIISVGRFFVGSHSKKQLEMVQFFVHNNDVFKNYEYHVVGAVSSKVQDQEYLREIKKLASTVDNVFIHENCKYEVLMDLYEQAKIFWHGTGYGIDENKEPEKMEHFGITTVEAMSYGAVPVVINKGGQKETVEEGVNGFRWDGEAECIEKTRRLIENDQLRKTMAEISAQRANDYSIEEFERRNREIFNAIRM